MTYTFGNITLPESVRQQAPFERHGNCMSLVTETPESPPSNPQPARPELPDARVLEDKTPLWMRTTPTSAVFTVLLGLVFVYIANRPLWHTDLWDHLNYGAHILKTHAVSQTEPLMRLCRGVPMVNIPWLAQIGMTALNDKFGLTALQFLTAVLVTLCLAPVVRRAWKNSHSMLGGLIACGIFLKTNLHEFQVIRPQLAGLVFYCFVLAWMFGQRRHSKLTWVAFPLMFALWGNIHGSFSLGLFLLGLAALGRFGDVVVIARSLKTALLDREFHKTILLTQLCAAAVLLNPSGLSVYPEVFNVAGNENVASMFEWEPLTLRLPHGQTAAAVLLLAIMAIRLSPRRIHCGEMLAFVTTGLLAAWSARMLNWWAPVAALLIGVHLTAGIRKTSKWLQRGESAKPSGLWSVVNGGILWIIFALTPFGMQIVHGRTLDLKNLVSRETPIATTAFLETMEDRPDGIVFVPAEWAGYVMNRGPADLEPMVNLHVHVIPERVWADYLKLNNGPSDWDGLMDEYGINMAVVNKQRQGPLVRRLKESPDWTASYEDVQGIIFVRKVRI